MPVDLRIRGVAALRAELLKTGKRVRNVRPVLNTIADLMERQVGRQFKTAGRRARTQWRGLAVSTTAARVRRTGYYRQAPGPRPGILQWTGRTRRSFTRGGRGHIRRVRATGLEWGSDYPVAAFHQRTRPMIAFTPRQEELITAESIRLWIEGLSTAQIYQRVRSRVGL